MKVDGYLKIAVAAFLLPMLASCRNELCYNHYPSIDLSFSWEQEWERDYGKAHEANWDESHYGYGYGDLRPSRPEWVNTVRYSETNTPSEKYYPLEGGEMIVEHNVKQSMLIYNGDTEYIVLSDVASLPEDVRASATTRTRATLTYMMQQHPNVRSTNPPDVLYSAYIEELPAVETHEVREMPVKMQPLVYTYLVRYEFEKGQEHVAIARGALGGMAESVYLRNGATSDNEAIILYDCETTPYGCEAQVRSFGIPGFPDKHYGKSTPETSDNKKYTLNLEVKLNNGKLLEYNFDITDQVADQPRGGVITVSGIRVEDEDSLYESGFDVDVSGWGPHEDIDLPVGTTE